MVERPVIFAYSSRVRTCVIFNPTARGDKARHLREHLDVIARDCALKPTTCAGDARRLATEAVRDGFEVVVAAGGDGTVNEVINGIGDAPGGFQQVRFGLLPLGTVNVLAKEHGIPVQWKRAWETIRHGRELVIDLGIAESTVKGQPERRYFAQMAGAGLDARAIELVSWELKKKWGQLAYLVAGVQALREKPGVIECTCAEGKASGELVLIGNGRFYGGKLPVFGDALVSDGLLDVCVFPQVKVLSLAGYATGFVNGKVYPPADMVRLRTKQLELRSSARVATEVEGDLLGELPMTVRVEPRSLRLLVPAG